MFFYENELFGDNTIYRPNIIENFNFAPHFHRSYELLSVISGEMKVIIDDVEYNLKESDVLIIFPNQIHSFETQGYSMINLIIFSPELVGMFYSEYKNLVPENNRVVGFDFGQERAFTDNVFIQKSILYKAIGTLVDTTTFKRANVMGDFKLIHRILSFVEENFAKECSLKDAAKILKYDYAYLSKQFIRAMNMSYTEYLNRYRISHACYLINNKNASIGDIYLNCGFENARSFNRNFKKYTGMTPSEYKNDMYSKTYKEYNKLNKRKEEKQDGE